MNSNEPADLITLLVTLLAIIAGKEIAAILGPYAAIFLGACAGAALSLSANETEMKPLPAVVFVSVRVLVAVVLTVFLAEFLQYFRPEWKARILVVPIAFVIGFIRDYESIRSWINRMVKKRAEKQFGEVKGPNDGTQ